MSFLTPFSVLRNISSCPVQFFLFWERRVRTGSHYTNLLQSAMNIFNFCDVYKPFLIKKEISIMYPVQWTEYIPERITRPILPVN